uniref:serine/threonine-protein kinase Nek9-like n=1 Tax=Pristiophorus japonicus TaxID=55135 RepID=UPI00398E6731
MARNLLGSEIQGGPNQVLDGAKMHVLDLYCESDKLKRPHPQTLAEFEKIHIVGKGAYGTAVLYRKKDDDSLVILKEINMHELNHIERQRAMNEVKVLSMLDHPNIINYYDSFEEDGVLMIEMEYADGGTLAQYLAQQDRELEEREILNLFHQMMAATCYLHEHNVLHRDLKTANLFLTKEGEVKLGDFGVAKVMTTGSEAHTILGTPYYISPEICEGKCYNDKSDIWSLGCILYEMACRQRTFEGTNLPAVVNKIMKGQFAPITNNYSTEFKALVMDMLQKEAQYRPSARELLHIRLPGAMAKYEETPDYEEGPGTGLQSNLSHKRNGRMALYYFCMSDLKLCPIEGLPAKIKIRQVAVTDNHMIAVAAEMAVYTWGNNLKGQLGHGDLQSRSRPQLVEALKGKFIVRACCGDGFSVFVSDNGIVMTSGDGAQGCLGHGDHFSTARPCLIEALLSVNVQAIACGQHHVVCVSGDGEVFSWGNGKYGKLGLGNDDDHCLPMEVTFVEKVFIRDVKCGLDGTMFLTDTDSLLACGNNQYNKLGLNERRGLLMQMTMLFARTDVEGRKVPTVVKALRNHRVRDAVLGPSHSIVLVEPGNIYSFGRNAEGQLGTGNTKPYKGPVHAKQLQHRTITTISCGKTFSVVGTEDNSILFWGTKCKSVLSPNPSVVTTTYQTATKEPEACACPASPSHVGTEEPMTGTVCLSGSKKLAENERPLAGISVALERKPFSEDESDAPRSPLSTPTSQKDTSCSKPDSLEEHITYMNMTSVKGERKTLRETSPGSSKPECKDARESGSTGAHSFGSESSLQDRESSRLLLPVPIMSLQQSLEAHADVHAPCLRSVICSRESIYVLVEDTDPPCHRHARRYRSFRKRGNREGPELKQGRVLQYSHSSNEAGDEYTSSEMSELETGRVVPTWIRKELNDADPQDAGGSEKGSETDTVTTSASEKTTDTCFAESRMTTASKINKEAQPQVKKEVAGGVRKTSGNCGGEKNGNTSTSGSSDGQLVPIKQKMTRSNDKRRESVQDFVASTSQRRHYRSEVDVGPLSPQGSTNPVRACGRNVSESPWKSGMLKSPGTGNQRSLNRLRVGRGHGKNRAAWMNAEASAVKSSKYYQRPALTTSPLSNNKDAELASEVKGKLRVEGSIQPQEGSHTSLHLLEEQQRLALEREARLQTEIDKLYRELKEQKQLLKQNSDVMQQLQEQLLKVQSHQFRSSTQAEREQADKSTTKPESKICIVM